MSQKPKSKLPAGWDVYSNANHKPAKAARPIKAPGIAKPVRRTGVAWWKYAVWALVIAILAGIAFFPWSSVGVL